MQAYYPDINTKYITHDRVILNALPNRKWSTCIGALNTINGLMPEEFQVQFSTAKYEELTKQQTIAICNFCTETDKEGKERNTELDYNDIVILELILPNTIGFICNKLVEKVWLCPQCKHENKLANTKIIKNSLAEPHFLKVVPYPPSRKDGLMDRSSYDRKMEQWVWLAKNEIDHQIALFRGDNVNRAEEEGDDYDPDTHLEDY